LKGQMTEHRSVTILGATGSVGASTADLIAAAGPEQFTTEAVTAQTNVQSLAIQAKRLGAKLAVIGDPARYQDLKEALLGSGIACAAGQNAIIEAAARPSDIVMAAIVGAAGLRPTLAGVSRGATIALANKECLVTAGAFFMSETKRANAAIIPVDSEHSAVFQVLSDDRNTVKKVTLTASGGPFWRSSLEDMASAGPREACAHPNWSMGAKISVDSATLMNKGLELIEASVLFGLRPDQLDVLVHRQSIIHALVSYTDGSVLAQLSHPDMKTPIAYALAHPRRMAWPAKTLDLAAIGQLTFEKPDLARFPCLRLAMAALHGGGGLPTVLNAANEEAVSAFLQGALPFLAIAEVSERVLTALEHLAQTGAVGLEAVLALDLEARHQARAIIDSLAPGMAVA
jgi:1-deoxy-D-xylulose-5-phosphate reductoisomerase